MAARATKSFYGNKVSYYRVMHAAVAHMEINESYSTNIVMISPRLWGNDSNIEQNIIEEHRTNGYAER